MSLWFMLLTLFFSTMWSYSSAQIPVVMWRVVFLSNMFPPRRHASSGIYNTPTGPIMAVQRMFLDSLVGSVLLKVYVITWSICSNILTENTHSLPLRVGVQHLTDISLNSLLFCIMLHWTMLLWSQYHACWFPGSLHSQDISRHDFGHVE